MKNFSYLFIFILPIILTQCTSSGGKQEAQPSVEKEEVSELGNISIEVSGSAEARPYFIEGLLLMHSFEYEDAAENL
jgi:hypothetical protein